MRLRRVLGRFRVDPLLSLASANDFVCGPGRRLTEEEFRQRRPTPYAVRPRARRVVWAVTPDPATLVSENFVNRAQFEQATHVVTTSFDELHRLAGVAAEIDRPVFIYNTGRCGSTLLVRLLACCDGTVGISEPDYFLGATPQVAADATRLMMEALGVERKRPIFKLRGYGSLPDAAIRGGFADARRLFLYRDGLDTVVSGMRNFHGARSVLGGFDRLCRSRAGRPLAHALLALGRTRAAALSPAMARADVGQLVRAGGAGLLAVNWVSALDGAVHPAYAYERLIAEPAETIAALFADAGLSPTERELHEAIRMVEERRDPHAGDRLDPSRSRRWSPTDAQLEAISEILRSVDSTTFPRLRRSCR